MCQIFIKNPDQKIPFLLLKNAFDNNCDGIGILKVNNDGNEVVHELASWSRCQELIEESIPHKSIIHFRYGTSGGYNEHNLHPFPLKDGWWLFHNGILDCIDTNEIQEGDNDTRTFIRTHLDPIMGLYPDKILEHLIGLGLLIGNENRMILVDPDGQFHFINEHTFVNYHNLMCGNTYSMVSVQPLNRRWIHTTAERIKQSDEIYHDRLSGVLYIRDRNRILWCKPSEFNYSPAMMDIIQIENKESCTR